MLHTLPIKVDCRHPKFAPTWLKRKIGSKKPIGINTLIFILIPIQHLIQESNPSLPISIAYIKDCPSSTTPHQSEQPHTHSTPTWVKTTTQGQNHQHLPPPILPGISTNPARLLRTCLIPPGKTKPLPIMMAEICTHLSFQIIQRTITIPDFRLQTHFPSRSIHRMTPHWLFHVSICQQDFNLVHQQQVPYQMILTFNIPIHPKKCFLPPFRHIITHQWK